MNLKQLLWVILSVQFAIHHDIQAQGKPDVDPLLWTKIDMAADTLLFEKKMDIEDLVAKVSAGTPATLQDAMFKLNVLMRAGMIEESITALKELKRFWSGGIFDAVSGIYDEASKVHSSWRLVKALIEIFADNIQQLHLDYSLLRNMKEAGWTVEQIDDWMAQLPPGYDHLWIKERLRFNNEHERGAALVRQLSDSVRKNPEDIAWAVDFLKILRETRVRNEKYDLEWMAGIIKPARAIQAYTLADNLADLHVWTTAAVFFQRAMEVRITDDEIQELRKTAQVYFPDTAYRAGYAIASREGMAKCMIGLDRKPEAQKWLEEAEGLREKNNYGINPLFAGQVQFETGGRTIEKKIKSEEKNSERDPKYWRERASYYEGRKDTAQEEEALKKELECTAFPKAGDDSTTREQWNRLSGVWYNYDRFLLRTRRIEELAEFLTKQIERAPAETRYTELAVEDFIGYSDLKKYITPDNEVFWRWLENRRVWYGIDGYLIEKMLQDLEEDKADRCLSRLEKLAYKGGASRAYILGWSLNWGRLVQRAVPLLEYAVVQTQDKEVKRSRSVDLVNAYFSINDWKRAEELLLKIDLRGAATDVRIALGAAKSKNISVAMRIWKTRANIYPTDLYALENLARCGLREELKEFYREMQKKMPASEVPARALKILEQK